MRGAGIKVHCVGMGEQWADQIFMLVTLANLSWCNCASRRAKLFGAGRFVLQRRYANATAASSSSTIAGASLSRRLRFRPSLSGGSRLGRFRGEQAGGRESGLRVGNGIRRGARLYRARPDLPHHTQSNEMGAPQGRDRISVWKHRVGSLPLMAIGGLATLPSATNWTSRNKHPLQKASTAMAGSVPIAGELVRIPDALDRVGPRWIGVAPELCLGVQ